MEGERRFSLPGGDTRGLARGDTVRADDELTALRELMAGGLTVTELAEAGVIEVRRLTAISVRPSACW